MLAWLRNLPEPIRYLLAGIANTIFGYSLFAVGLFLLTGPLRNLPDFFPYHAFIADYYYSIIQWLMWVLSVPFGAATFKYYAFCSPGPYIRQAIKSYGVYLPAQLLSAGLLILGVEWLGLHPLVSQALTLVFATVVSYFGHKYITFRPTTTTD